MRTIEINKKELEKLTGREFTEKELLNDASHLGVKWHKINEEKYKAEIPQNRPDLLSVEGLARAYRGFFGLKTGLKKYDIDETEIKVHKKDSVDNIRPYIANAVVRNLELTDEVIQGLVQLQEGLDVVLGERRKKLAVGFHDMDEIEPPITYLATKGESRAFVPLGREMEMTINEILDKHKKGKEYSWTLEGKEKYPILVDARDRVFSFPPITNSQLTEVTPETESLFIDITGEDKKAVMMALNIVVVALAERGKVESIETDGQRLPDLDPDNLKLEKNYFRKMSGLNLDNEEIIENLEKMRLGAELKNNEIEVKVPVYRDLMKHECDLVEDALIAYRYDEIDPEEFCIKQKSYKEPLEEFSYIVRNIFLRIGATEVNTSILSESPRIDKWDQEHHLSNSKESEKKYDFRTQLLSPILEVLKKNKHNTYPQKFFEIGDVLRLEDSEKSHQKKALYIETGREVDFNSVKKMLQVLEQELDTSLSVKDSEKPFLKDQRSGEIYLEDQEIGFIGEIREEIKKKRNLEREIAAFEINLETLHQKN